MEKKFDKIINELSDLSSVGNLYDIDGTRGVYPSSESLQEVMSLLRFLLFPGFYGKSTIEISTLKFHIGVAAEQLFDLLKSQIFSAIHFCSTDKDKSSVKSLSEDIAYSFIAKLPSLRKILSTDVESAYYGDPAAKSFSEIILCYPGFRAIINYRVAHELLKLGVPLMPRMISEMAHSETGIDIHPGATIGSYFTIDHGTGIVIGETTIIGNHVKLYQGVTLGAKSFEVDKDGNPVKNIARHPIIEDNVVIYANATILGRIVIGEGAVIGGNLWVTSDVAKGGKVLQFKPTR